MGVWDFEARASGNHNDTEATALESFTIDLSHGEFGGWGKYSSGARFK